MATTTKTRGRPKVKPAPAERRIGAGEFAKLLGVNSSTFRGYVTRKAVPDCGRDPETGERWWPLDVAEEFADNGRPGGMAGVGLRTHLLIHEIDRITGDVELEDAVVAGILKVSRRTVYRHRSKQCNCGE